MATFSIKKTGVNMSAWDYYIEGKSDWKTFQNNIHVEYKRKDPPELYLDKKGESVSAKTLRNNQKLKLLDNKSVTIDGDKCGYVQAGGEKGYLSIRFIGKPKRDTTKDENIALEKLDKAIKERDSSGNGITIIVKDRGGKVAFTFENCVSAKTIKGTPKADFSIRNKNGKDICFISHKKAGGAAAYQQYVSVTGRKRDGINNHPLLTEALRFLARERDGIAEERNRFMFYIPFNRPGHQLINRAVYGEDFGKAYGKEHVHFIGQGTPILKEASPKDRPLGVGTAYELGFSDDLSVSGDLSHFSNSGYKPIILARYTAGRKFYSDGNMYEDVRILIAPEILASASAVEVGL